MTDLDDRQPGIFGKVPTRGDFITRRLPSSFVGSWDAWLQEAITESREQLAEAWLDIYLTSPIWRFALASGVAGQSAWAGLLMPSVDRVGRYFPLTLAAPLPEQSNVVQVASDGAAWYAAAETLLLSCLDDGFDLEGFDRSLIDLRVPLPAHPELGCPTDALRSGAVPENARRLALPGGAQVRDALPILLSQALAELYFGYSLWWTDGSERVSPSLLLCQGLPPIQGFSALLGGDWTRWGWPDSAVLPLDQGRSGSSADTDFL